VEEEEYIVERIDNALEQIRWLVKDLQEDKKIRRVKEELERQKLFLLALQSIRGDADGDELKTLYAGGGSVDELERIKRFHRYVEALVAGALVDEDKPSEDTPLCPHCGAPLCKGQYRQEEGYLNTVLCGKCRMEYELKAMGKRKVM